MAAVRVAGLDVGARTIGVAVSDPMGWTAQGVAVIRREGDAADLASLQVIFREREVTRVVVGLPRNMNGTYGPQAEAARAFGASLARATGLPVEYWDERLTTAQAQRALLAADVSRARRKQVVDKIAAQFILQGYLDARARKSGGSGEH